VQYVCNLFISSSVNTANFFAHMAMQIKQLNFKCCEIALILYRRLLRRGIGKIKILLSSNGELIAVATKPIAED